MKVLLVKDVKSLGKIGEIKEVKDGYGKNFLIKNGFAKHATNDIIKKWESDNKKAILAEKKELEKLEKLKIKIEKLEIVTTHKIGANGHLFGAITKDEIAKELELEHGITVDKKSIKIDKPIKTIGVHQVSINLSHSFHAKLKMEVKGE
jgi:large subunit ribosomal protein L9